VPLTALIIVLMTAPCGRGSETLRLYSTVETEP
jgi:hypothetical protein